MTRHWTGWLLAVCGLAGAGLLGFAQRTPEPASEAAQEQAKAEKALDGSPLVFLGSKRPVLLRLRIEVDGQPVQKTWRDYLKKWFDYLDRDGDGKLDAQELGRAPQAQGMLQLMRQGFYFPDARAQMRMADFGKKDEEKVGLDDFCRYYQSKSAGPIQLGAGGGGFGGLVFNAGGQIFGGGAPNAGLGDALFKVLDLNKDGKLSREEIEQAEKTLLKLDSDDDEWITAAEILPAANTGIGRGIFTQPSPQPASGPMGGFVSPPPDADAPMAILLLAHYDRDKNKKLSRAECALPRDVFDRLDTNKDGELDAEELSRWHLRPADLTFTVRLGKTRGAAVTELAAGGDKKLAKAVTKAGDAQMLALGDAEIQLRRDTGGTRFVVDVDLFGRSQYMAVFRQADKNKRGFVELKDLQGSRQGQLLAQIFPLVDRDADGKLTQKEMEEFVRLQSTAPVSYASVSVAEHGRNFFQLLDANGDGRLSLREMRAAWSRLKDRIPASHDCLELGDLARQFQLVVDRGSPNGRGFRIAGLGGAQQPRAPSPTYPPATPAWFKKMDRNADGDVSFREFLGTREEFNRIDTDRDGLISPEEAIRFEERMRKEKK